ncbi:MAG: hypothetical protein AAFR18_11800 [Cyanobacteria bacterium J06627_32]
MNEFYFTRTSKVQTENRNPYRHYVQERFGPVTAVVTEVIVGGSNKLGVIRYHGGCYAKALTYKQETLIVGTKVKVLGRIYGQNIWVVSSLPPLMGVQDYVISIKG